MTGLRYSPLHVTEFCGEMQGKFKVGLARLIILASHHCDLCDFEGTHELSADDFLQTCYQDMLAL